MNPNLICIQQPQSAPLQVFDDLGLLNIDQI